MNYNKLREAYIEAYIMSRSVCCFILFDMICTVAINFAVASLKISAEELATHNIVYAGSFLLLLILLVANKYIRPIRSLQLYLSFKILLVFMFVAFLIIDEILIYPPLAFVLFIMEILYFLLGLFNKSMRFPGYVYLRFKYAFIKNLKEIEEEDKKKLEKKKPHPFTSIANEVIRKDCTHPDEFEDELFDYRTASEDELFSSSMYTADDSSIKI